MTCEKAQSHLTALEDGELTPDLTTEVQTHLASCPDCAARRTDFSAVARMASAWAVDTPDVAARVMKSLAPDAALLDELRELRSEMRALRAEVAALRRHLPRPFDPYALPSAPAPARSDYPRMENDPWNLTRS